MRSIQVAINPTDVPLPAEDLPAYFEFCRLGLEARYGVAARVSPIGSPRPGLRLDSYTIVGLPGDTESERRRYVNLICRAWPKEWRLRKVAQGTVIHG